MYIRMGCFLTIQGGDGEERTQGALFSGSGDSAFPRLGSSEFRDLAGRLRKI